MVTCPFKYSEEYTFCTCPFVKKEIDINEPLKSIGQAWKDHIKELSDNGIDTSYLHCQPKAFIPILVPKAEQ